MVRIRYRLTAEDFAELKAERRGGLIKRILRILAGSFLGLLGLALVWQACFFWSRHLWPADLTVASMGLVLLWVGIDAPGLTWLLHRLSDAHAQREIDVYEGKLAWSSGNRSHESAWIPERGFQENAKFSFYRRSDRMRGWLSRSALSILTRREAFERSCNNNPRPVATRSNAGSF